MLRVVAVFVDTNPPLFNDEIEGQAHFVESARKNKSIIRCFCAEEQELN